LIILDLGQSGSRISLNGQIHQLNRGKLAGESVLDSITQIASMLPAATSDVAALSITGVFGIVESAEPYHQLAKQIWGVKETVVIDDGLAGYYGALGGRDGVALTLGGGVVAVAGRAATFAHTDGLGSIFGDEGSGYWLGSRGIVRALATQDQRDYERDLELFMRDELAAFDRLAVKNSSEAVSLAISSAKKVLDAADAGISIAVAIREEGAMRLAHTVIGAWEKAGGAPDETPTIAISGGLSRNQSYVNLIMEKVRHEIADAEQIAPVGNNLDGAQFIAENIGHDQPPLMKWARE
jgi:N-acetylglucosamine kinase-like BadF-type ATPase